MEIFLALLDFVPVILCFVAFVELQKLLYHQMSKYAFAMLAAGSIMVLYAGSCKAIWKLCYFIFNFDWEVLNTLMFPTQAFGFIFALVGLIIMFIDFKRNHNGDIKTTSVALLPLLGVMATLSDSSTPEVFNGTMIFVVFQIIGTFGIYGIISFISFKTHKPIHGVLMIVACVLMLGMGYLSTKTTNDDGTINLTFTLIAELINTCAQSILLFVVLTLKKIGISNLKELVK